MVSCTCSVHRYFNSVQYIAQIFKKNFCVDICKDDDYDGDDEKRTGSLNSGMYIMYTLDKKIRNNSTVYCRWVSCI